MNHKTCWVIGVLPGKARWAALILVAVFAGAVSSLDAQEVALEAGSHVRVKAPPSHPDWVEGTYSGYAEGSLALAPERSGSDSLLLFARNQIAELEVYRGRKSAAGKGALVGLGFGAAAGITIGLAGCQGFTEDCIYDADAVEVALIFGAVVGAVGAGIGSLIGLAAGTDDWEPVPMEGLRISIRPGPAGRWEFAFSATFSD